VGVALAGARLAGVPAALLGPAISQRLGLGKTVVVASVLAALAVLPLALVRTPLAASAGLIGLIVFSNIRYPAFNI
jgi:MFS-type transporter involved in bile tolerance (Atg22 family)